MQTLAERVPGLGVELGTVGKDQVLQTGYSRPGKSLFNKCGQNMTCETLYVECRLAPSELFIILLDTPLQLGEEIV